MGDTPSRMLDLLGLLQARSSWSGAELAHRLGVTDRTLRRDVDRLRTLGYPVEATSGRYGGYQLGRGGSLPPLLLNDEEAVAVAIGLRAAVDGTVSGLEDSAASVIAKLDQLLPAHLAVRVRAVHDNTANLGAPLPPERVEASHLVVLAHACSSRQRVRFDYLDRGGRSSRRLVEPLGVVRRGPRWYLAARDVDRADWRTFRLDRIADPENVGTRFERVDPPDPVELLTDGLASVAYPFTARIRVPVSLDEAMRMIPRTLAMFDTRDGATVVEVGSWSMERMVGYLAGLRLPCEVLEPIELRRALAEHARLVSQANVIPSARKI